MEPAKDCGGLYEGSEIRLLIKEVVMQLCQLLFFNPNFAAKSTYPSAAAR